MLHPKSVVRVASQFTIFTYCSLAPSWKNPDMFHCCWCWISSHMNSYGSRYVLRRDLTPLKSYSSHTSSEGTAGSNRQYYYGFQWLQLLDTRFLIRFSRVQVVHPIHGWISTIGIPIFMTASQYSHDCWLTSSLFPELMGISHENNMFSLQEMTWYPIDFPHNTSQWSLNPHSQATIYFISMDWSLREIWKRNSHIFMGESMFSGF